MSTCGGHWSWHGHHRSESAGQKDSKQVSFFIFKVNRRLILVHSFQVKTLCLVKQYFSLFARQVVFSLCERFSTYSTGSPAWLAAAGCVCSDRWASWYFQTACNLSPLLLHSHSGRCSPETQCIWWMSTNRWIQNGRL